MMTSTRKMTSGLALLFVAASCGGTETTPAADAQVQVPAASSDARRGFTLPPVTGVGDWRDRLLYPETARAVFTVMTQAPDDASRFRAYGVDVTSREVVFVVEGSKSDELGIFNAELGQTVGRLGAIENVVSFRDGILGDLNIPPPGPHTPQGDGEFAARLVHLGNTELSLGIRALETPLPAASR